MQFFLTVLGDSRLARGLSAPFLTFVCFVCFVVKKRVVQSTDQLIKRSSSRSTETTAKRVVVSDVANGM